MKIRYALWAAALLIFPNVHAPAATLYVDLNSTNPVPPYASWSTAATNIQDAVDVSTNGDLILVTNGVYQSGGNLSGDGATNCVVVTDVITLESVNGPALTLIDGRQLMRCVYLAEGATLAGFTVTNGYAVNSGLWNGGGVYAYNANLTNCVIVNNTSGYYGGGVYYGNLVNCVLIGNSSQYSGGGAYYANLTNCVIANNSTSAGGGGVYYGNLVNCNVTGNSAKGAGGGTVYASQINCIVYYNMASNTNFENSYGGSFSYCCTTPLPGGTGNIANDPLLASSSRISLNSPCRGAGNGAATSGVDIDGNPWANPPSIGCEEPYPGGITGNITMSITASDTGQAPGYPVNFQANISGQVYASTWNFGDGTVVSNEPYVSHSWSAVGDYPVVLTAYNDSYPMGQTATFIMHVYQPTVFYVALSNQAPVAPYDSWAKAATDIQSAIDVANPGNLILVSNGVYQSGSRISSDGGTNRVAVDKPVIVRSVNGSSATLIDGGNTLRCAYLTNGAVLDGFTLTNGNAVNGGGLFCTSTNALVSNCLLVKNKAQYGIGAYSGFLSNCMVIDNSDFYSGFSFGDAGAYSSILNDCIIATNAGVAASYDILNDCLVSNNTIGGAYNSTLNRCYVFQNGISLSESGWVYGTYDCTLNNCTLSDNVGGGMYGGSATNCLIVGNRAGDEGGGASYSTLVNCTVVNNTSTLVGGTFDCTLEGCIVYYNTNHDIGGGSANYCCVTPLPASVGSGLGNITNAPLFVDLTGGDFHLQSNSPCINSGDNGYVTSATDLDGNPRIVGGTVDIGAYEYQRPVSMISYAWLQQYGLPIAPNTDASDPDGDGMNNYQEWIAGTNPTNALSVLEMLNPASTNNPAGLIVSWESVSNRTYFLQSSTNLAAQPAFSTIQSNIVGQPDTTSYTDTNAVGSGPFFYRVGVQ